MGKAVFLEDSTTRESTKPGDSGTRVASDERNQLSALFQGDLAPLRARAQDTPNMTLKIGGLPVEGFFAQLYRDGQPVTFAGGNSPAISAPSTNPRYDILTLDSGGTLAWITGTEAGSPVEPWDSVPADSIPIAIVYCRVGMTKIVNYEDKDAFPTHGYVYKDVRPLFVFGAGANVGGKIEYGCLVSNDVTDPTNDLSIATGAYWDDTYVYPLRLTSALIKRGDASFAAGTNQGGGNITGAAALKYVYLIGKTTDEDAVDIFFSASAPGAVSLPSGGWDLKRCIFALYWDGSAWVKFMAAGNGLDKDVEFMAPILLTSSLQTSPTDVSCGAYVPASICRRATIEADSFQGSTSEVNIYARPNGSAVLDTTKQRVASDHDDQSGPGNPHATGVWEQMLDASAIFELWVSGGSGYCHMRGYRLSL